MEEVSDGDIPLNGLLSFAPRTDGEAIGGTQATAADSAPRSASVAADTPDAAQALAGMLGPGPFALIVLFASLQADIAPLLADAARHYPHSRITGCTTAGEIGASGYETGQIVALALPETGFAAEYVVIENIEHIATREIVAEVLHAREDLTRRAEALPHDLAILLVDGLSGQEEALIAALTGGLGHVPMVGGSAGDSGHFRNAKVFADGRILDNAAILCLIRSRGELRNFSFDNNRPSSARMIVTAADPLRRIVTRINDEPAALEYARLVGLPVDALTADVFATRPVLVRAGGSYHARAIRHALPDNSLVFFSAIAEGMVLTIAQSSDIAEHLEGALAEISAAGAPDLILGFDCIFRRIDAESRQKGAEVSRILANNRVVGFSTYGEQFGGLHVNQTLTGVAFYPPEVQP